MDYDIINHLKENPIKHIAIIMDGNGRWASARGLKRNAGHKEGSERVIDITERCDQLGVKYLSLYAFSTENWKRPEEEVSGIMGLLNKFINRELNNLVEKNVQLRIMGDVKKLPYSNRKAVEYAINKTKDNDGLILNIGLNYGSRSEILRSFKLGIKEVIEKDLDPDKLDNSFIEKNLYTSDMPDPDLMIRTGGEFRISNFMLYQLAYTEFYFTDTLWPDFKAENLDKAIENYLCRSRRYGGLNE